MPTEGVNGISRELTRPEHEWGTNGAFERLISANEINNAGREEAAYVRDKTDEKRRRRATDAASVSRVAAVRSMSMHASVTLCP